MHLTLDDTTVAVGDYVSWYTCGITPHAETHVGQARVYVTCDAIKRVLRGLMHCTIEDAEDVTDVDRRILERALREGTDMQTVAARHVASHQQAMAALNVRPPQHTVWVTDCIPAIVSFVAELLAGGHAERTPDGVRFSGAPRMSLWKLRAAGAPGWPSPWGHGTPGWHVQCATIGSCLFREGVDFYAGGVELRSGHHAHRGTLAAARDGESGIRSHVHVGRVEVPTPDGPRDLCEVTVWEALQSVSAEALRMLFLTAPWESTLAYSDTSLAQAQAQYTFLSDTCALSSAPAVRDCGGLELVGALRATIIAALANELDIAHALGLTLEMASGARDGTLPLRPVQGVIEWVLSMLGFVGAAEKKTKAWRQTLADLHNLRGDMRRLANKHAALAPEIGAITDRMRLLLGGEEK